MTPTWLLCYFKQTNAIHKNKTNKRSTQVNPAICGGVPLSLDILFCFDQLCFLVTKSIWKFSENSFILVNTGLPEVVNTFKNFKRKGSNKTVKRPELEGTLI